MKRLFLNKRAVLIAAPFITAVWLLAIYYLKGIYPFGSGTVIDCDLYQGDVPAFFYIYDAWHGGSLFYDFTTACGAGRDITLSLLNPSNLFLLLFKREMLINAVSLLLILKLCVISFTSAYSLSKLFPKLSSVWLCALPLMYTFCGYNIEYFTNFDWLDAVALYPLILLFTKRMFDGKSRAPFFITLTYMLVVNPYMAFFVLLSLVVFGGLYIFTVESSERRKNDVLALGMGTLGALVASSFSLYKYYRCISDSARFGIGTSVFGNSAESGTESAGRSVESVLSLFILPAQADTVKLFMYFGAELALVCLILLAARSLKNKALRGHTVFFVLSSVMLVCQTVLLSTDKLWHGGSYVMFPMRNGYMIGMLCCLIAAYYYSTVDAEDGITVKSNVLKLLLPVLCAFSLVFTLPQIKVFSDALPDYFNVLLQSKLVLDTLRYPFIIMFSTSVMSFILFKLIKNKPLRTALTLVLLAVYLFTGSYSFIGRRENSEQAIKYNSYYGNCFDVLKNQGDVDALSRINNTDVSLITNYPYLSKSFAVSNWTHRLSQKQIDALKALGFSSAYTRILDSGATAFSKSLIRITNSVSKAELDESLYEKTATGENGFNYYRDRYVLPVGLAFDGSISSVLYENYQNTFDYQNAIYYALSGDENLFERLSANEITEGETEKEYSVFENSTDTYKLKKITARYTVSGKKTVYLTLNGSGAAIDSIYVNGSKLDFYALPDYTGKKDTDTVFPNTYNNNVLELGTFENCEVEIEYRINNAEYTDMNIYALDLGKLENLCEEYTENSYSVENDTVKVVCNAEDGQIIFLPIAYDENWECTVNGTESELICILGDFVGVRAQDGENSIVLKYSHKAEYINIAATALLTGLIFVLTLMLEKRRRAVPKPVLTVMYIAFIVLFSAAVTVLYLLPSAVAAVTALTA